MITLVEKDDCMQCVMMKKVMEKKHIQYKTIKTEDAEGIIKEAKTRGIRSYPIVVLEDGEMYGGFRPDIFTPKDPCDHRKKVSK